jgi:hypothetical protein
VKQPVENRADGPGLLRRVIVLFQLAQNLWLANYHGIKTCGDAEQVPHGVSTAITIKMVAEVGIM